jgi:hypothetical protein
MSMNASCGLLAILLAISMREKLRRANKQLDLQEAEASSSEVPLQGVLGGDDVGGSPAKLPRYVI